VLYTNVEQAPTADAKQFTNAGESSFNAILKNGNPANNPKQIQYDLHITVRFASCI
jgi:hypothetical protein